MSKKVMPQRLVNLFRRLRNAICKRLSYPVARWRCDYSAESLSSLNPRSAVIYIPDKIGDAMSVFPLIRSLDDKALDSLVIVVSPNNRSVFHNVTCRHLNIHLIDAPIHTDASCRDIRNLAKRIRRQVGRPDLFFDAIRFDKYKPLVLIGLLKSRINYQVGRLPNLPCFSPVCRNAIQLHADNAPILDVWKQLLTDAGLPVPDRGFEFPVAPAIRQEVEEHLPRGMDYIALNLEGSLSWKSIDLDTAREMIKLMVNRFNLPIVMLTSPAGRGQAMTLAGEFKEVQLLPVAPSLDCSASIVGNAALVVTPDTSILHMAGAFDTPVVAVYAANHNNAMWPPTSSLYRRIQTNGNVSSVSLEEVDDALLEIGKVLGLSCAPVS